MRILGVNLSGIIRSAFRGKLLPATLLSAVNDARTPGALSAGQNVTYVPHAAEGFVEDYEVSERDGTIVQRGDRVVTLIGDSIAGLAVPAPNDKVTIEGATYFVVSVERDPAAATYVLQVR